MGDCENKVKCNDCAFLSLKDRGTGGYLELDRPYREGSGATEYLHRNLIDNPVCFAMAADLDAEIAAAVEILGPARLPMVISKDRDCAEFMAWVNGYSPKEMAERKHNAKIIRIAENRKIDDEARADVRILADKVLAESNRKKDLLYKILLPILAIFITYYLPKINDYLGF